MPIQRLSPQLANQIAAGEVVERPAAVVKELVENSIDAGADQITINIEEGGVRLIALHDNGQGIPREDLSLALERHATSKISSLEDLQAVSTLGFRGEALASIGAVSRLTLSSRTAEQAEGWQLYREGGEGQELIHPVSHPLGTRVQISDLFYNTPVRRKFLRSAKTEFLHIDEVVRRLALSRLSLEIILNHNGKRVRNYRPADNLQQPQSRLAAICGTAFAEQALFCQQQHLLLTLQGWIMPLGATRLSFECQYCIINGRVVRDKTVSHAVRQAYQRLNAEQQPAFVLLLTLDPQQVDVNVHPTKQEVRFQQARLIHGVIYQAIVEALSAEAMNQGRTLVTEGGGLGDRVAKDQWLGAHTASPQQLSPVSSVEPTILPPTRFFSGKATLLPASKGWHSLKLPAYKNLLQNSSLPTASLSVEPVATISRPVDETLPVIQDSMGRVLSIWQRYYAIVEKSHGLVLLWLPQLQRDWQRQQLLSPGSAVSLRLPLLISVSNEQLATVKRCQHLLTTLAWQVSLEPPMMTLFAVPALLISEDLSTLIVLLLNYLASITQVTLNIIVEYWVEYLTPLDKEWQRSQAIRLLAAVEQEAPHLVSQPSARWQQPIDLTTVIEHLTQAQEMS